ncbi:uncharacterized protein PFLUO_LOCUS6926 [Penicillium psychrofluorescens]|uniref:uncharacterized protein n=1 Tax=Penicillium psychrofluorescens TaxID=3158075 RepID=UPI003CCD1650
MHELIKHPTRSRSKKRVKTGCKTCKARRVKCDESRPVCRRCVSTGRVCDGYGVWGGGGTPYGQPQSNRALSIYCTPVPLGSLGREEQAYFDWFMNKTTQKFAGLFASYFWEILVFQACADEPAVRHAVVALSAAHRSDNCYQQWANPATHGFDAEQFMLQQYNKAIKYLSATTVNGNNNSLRIVLITCMIFVTLEYLCGEYQRGSAHLRSGIQLLSNISSPQARSSISPSVLSPTEDLAHNALIDAYERLSIQAAMFGHVPSHMCVVARDPQAYAMPYAFSSLVDARQRLDDLLNRIHCLKCHYYGLSSSKFNTDGREMYEAQRQISADLSLWHKAYDASLHRIEVDSVRDAKFGIKILKIYYELVVVMTAVCLSDDEMIFDSYTNKFLTIMTGFVDLWSYWASLNTHIKDVKDILSDPESDCDCHGFTVESGFIPPVYYTGLKCRNPRLRRQAIRILRAVPHREGVWNGPLLANVLEEVIKIEEDDVYAGDSSSCEPIVLDGLTAEDLDTPEIKASSRISDVSVLLPDKVEGDTFMTYHRRVGNHQGEAFKCKIRRGGSSSSVTRSPFSSS